MTLPRAYEDDLTERAKSDADAFGELYDHYVDQMYRFIYSRVREPILAEEITSDVFFKALKAIGRYRAEGHPFSSWLYQIASNAINDHYRSHRNHSNVDDAIDLHDGSAPLGETVVARDEARRVWDAIDKLPPQQRTAITLKLGEDLKLAQIGTIMGKSEGAIKLLVHRGMTTLRAQLVEGGEE